MNPLSGAEGDGTPPEAAPFEEGLVPEEGMIAITFKGVTLWRHPRQKARLDLYPGDIHLQVSEGGVLYANRAGSSSPLRLSESPLLAHATRAELVCAAVAIAVERSPAWARIVEMLEAGALEDPDLQRLQRRWRLWMREMPQELLAT